MAKYVPDIKTQRWVIIAAGRTRRPDDASSQKPACPFCEGKETQTPLETYRIGDGPANGPGWHVRVVPNKFPITDTHEVIIHSPDHVNDIESLPAEHVGWIVTAYRDRFRTHAADGQVIIFCNHGQHAGASLIHPHSQLVVVPRQINLDALSREPIANVVAEDEHMVTYCPDFSQWPFETWLTPKTEGTRFGDTPDTVLPAVAAALQAALKKIAAIYADPSLSHIHNGNPFGYNFYIYHGVNWFIRITPRFVHRAGFELGTGLNVNIVDPVEAAEKLKKIG
ncbi:DUF4931 domain-containing protein [Candidatus Gottesmanbacteria bacterium]|nr:DUF4931 domain-containing protein [Candidatus Gottesmanbacteria bacterium]